MSVLEPSDVPRFGKLLGLLGSDQHGERATAAAKATEFLFARKLAWSDITEMLQHLPVITQPTPAAAARSHQMDARQCLGSGTRWKDHEAKFLQQMASQFRRPSDAQCDWLDGLLDRAFAAKRRASRDD